MKDFDINKKQEQPQTIMHVNKAWTLMCCQPLM